MTTRRPTPGHTTRDHSNAHPRSGHPASGHPASGHSAMATLVGAARVATKWTLAGGLIAAASYMAGWVERGHSDGR